MSSIPQYGRAAPSQRKTQGVRRTWNELEEQTLIHCLKDMLLTGWKADNSFRAGYLQTLEVAINARIPNSTILAKHINSKLTVWKKTYYQLLGMQGTSEFGWNDSGKQISVDDDIWQLYVKAHPDVANMRYKTYHYFEDWVEIFGKDRATGDDAESFPDIVEDIHKNNAMSAQSNFKLKEPMGTTDESHIGSPCVDLTADASDDAEVMFDSATYNSGFDSMGPRKVKGKLEKKSKAEKIKIKKEGSKDRKRKTPESIGPDPSMPNMKEFIDAAKDTWGDLTSKFAKEEDTYDEKAKKIIAALENIETLSEENRNYLSFKIMDNAKYTSLFLNSNARNREIQAHMMLEGKMP